MPFTKTISGLVPIETAHEAANNSAYAANPASLDMTGAVATSAQFSALMRFITDEIPRGANITSAVLTVTPTDAANDDADLLMHCEDIGINPTLETMPSIFTERSGRLTASTAWAAGGLGTAAIGSPSFHNALQELVRRTDWDQASIGVIFAGTTSAAVLKVSGDTLELAVDYELLSAQFGLTTTVTGIGISYRLPRRVSEITLRCDTGSAAPVQFRVPTVHDDWYNLPAGTSLSVFSPPRDTGSRFIDEIHVRVASGTGTFSYVVSGV